MYFNSFYCLYLKYQIKLFTICQLLSLHPCCRIHATKCVQRTMALYRYKLFKVFPFSLVEICKVVMFKNGIQCVWSKTVILFSFLRLLRPPFGLWPRTLYYKWKNILLRASSVWFLRRSLLSALFITSDRLCCKGIPENQAHCSFFNLVYIASLRFSNWCFCVFSLYFLRQPYIFLGKMNM